jgi:hypothetical protein
MILCWSPDWNYNVFCCEYCSSCIISLTMLVYHILKNIDWHSVGWQWVRVLNWPCTDRSLSHRWSIWCSHGDEDSSWGVLGCCGRIPMFLSTLLLPSVGRGGILPSYFTVPYPEDCDLNVITMKIIKSHKFPCNFSCNDETPAMLCLGYVLHTRAGEVAVYTRRTHDNV